MEKINRREFVIRILIVALVAVSVVNFHNILSIITWMFGVILPFLIGIGIAYIWNLIMKNIERILFSKSSNKIVKKIKRPVSMLLSLLIILLVLAMVFYLVIPQIYDSISIIGENVPKLINDVQAWTMDKSNDNIIAESLRGTLQDVSANWEDYEAKIVEFVRTNIAGFLGSTFQVVNSIFGILLSAFTAIIFGAYLLSDKEKVKGQVDTLVETYLPRSPYKKVKYFFSVMNEKFAAYFKGQLIDAIAIGVVLYIALLITGMPYALSIAVVVAVTALIPMIGAFIGGGVGFLMVAAQDFKQGLIFLVVLVIVQELEANLIYPKLVGDSVGLPGIWTFAAVMVGGAVLGPLGMILFVPLAAGLYQIIARDIRKRNNSI